MSACCDVAIDSRQNPQVLTVFICRSKTDQSESGTRLYLERTGNILCPVSAMLVYLAICPPTPGPLFIFQDGSHLSRDRLVTHMRDTLSQLGVDVTKFSGHGFRIGAASSAAKAGFSDSFIQKLGRWKSDAFTTYIRTPVEDLAAASAVLSRANFN